MKEGTDKGKGERDEEEKEETDKKTFKKEETGVEEK